MSARIILASASSRRVELLAQIGVRALVRPVSIDESQNPDETVLDHVRRLAMSKAQCGFGISENRQLPVIGADTIVELNGEVLGKPENRLHAKNMLQRLSGQNHTVHTSVAIVTEETAIIDTSSTLVSFKELSDSEIESYLATGEADDKAGSYAIQGFAALFIKNINGSYSGVMGLPLYETARMLEQCEIRLLRQTG